MSVVADFGRIITDGYGKKKKETGSNRCLQADYGARTRHLNLGKVALYQMS